jgi:hypothetical protein
VSGARFTLPVPVGIEPLRLRICTVDASDAVTTARASGILTCAIVIDVDKSYPAPSSCVDKPPVTA